MYLEAGGRGSKNLCPKIHINMTAHMKNKAFILSMISHVKQLRGAPLWTYGIYTAVANFEIIMNQIHENVKESICMLICFEQKLNVLIMWGTTRTSTPVQKPLTLRFFPSHLKASSWLQPTGSQTLNYVNSNLVMFPF